MRGTRRLLLGAASALAFFLPRVTGAAESRPDSMPLPPAAALSYFYDAFEQGVARPATRALDLSLLVRKLNGSRREAANLDTQDRVLLPSTWWQPRIGFKPVSVEAMLEGPGPGTGPARGPWTIVAAKSSGVSKGFTAKDSTGGRFAIKFDAPNIVELATSADVVASKLYWAAGYNVPDNSIAYFRREDLRIAPDATRRVGGKKVPLTPDFVDELLRGIPQQPDGTYRVVASRFIKGKPLGEWRYDGRRKGDVEDLIPHQLRREIRGLWAINAWINHTDCSARNTLDMYVTDGGRSFVRHHLIDFSGCLGSASIFEQPPRSGHEYWMDYGTAAKSLATLSVPPYKWEHGTVPRLQGVGFIESETFDPGAWRPYLQNPALDERTERDIKWGARIVAAFTDEHIRAAVEQGRYSDPRATEYLVRVLEQRRDKIVRRWLTAEEVAAARTMSGLEPSEASADSASEPNASEADLEPVRKPGIGRRAGRAVGNFLTDGWTVVASPIRARGRNLVLLGAVIGTEAVLFANDQEIHDGIVRSREDPVLGGVIDVGNTIEPVGFMGRTNPIYVAALVAGYGLNIRVLRTIPTEILESHLLAGGVRNIGKLLVGRKHPYDNLGPYEFDFGHGTSFPSGHTSVAFELATIASMNARRWPVTVAAYSLATAMAVQRVESGNHWPSDVFIAAAYGTLVSRTVVKLHESREKGRDGSMSLLPHFSDDGRVIGVRVERKF